MAGEDFFLRDLYNIIVYTRAKVCKGNPHKLCT